MNNNKTTTKLGSNNKFLYISELGYKATLKNNSNEIIKL